MGAFKKIFNKLIGKDVLEEEIKAFKPPAENIKKIESRSGEGFEFVDDGYSVERISSFNTFYKRFLNQSFSNEIAKIKNYRMMAEMAEIADVIEDAVIESTQEDLDGNIFKLEIKEERVKNENARREISDAFNDLVYNRLNLNHKIEDMFRSYLIDGRLYYEKVIDEKNKKNGIISIKKLPSESMDFDYDVITGKIKMFMQYLKPEAKRAITIEEARKRKDIILFYPDQISFIDYGVYGRNRKDIIGYLDKTRVPYNQLKLLETSVVIYRIVRAPERFVFKIDTGNMPIDKAMKYTEKVKRKLSRTQTYNTSTGRLTNDPNIFSMIEDFYLPVSSDGRGSDVSTVGGNAKGFTELDDVYYFSRKLYRSLKYPLSRVSSMEEKRESDILFTGSPAGEISRDEVKWSIFLKRQQDKFCKSIKNTFIQHLKFKGIKIDDDDIYITMTPPSYYKERQQQNLMETHFNNYLQLANQSEFSKVFLQKEFLKWDDDKIEENQKFLKKERELESSSEKY